MAREEGFTFQQQTLQSFEEDFYYETLKSEKLRSFVLFIVLGVFAIIWYVAAHMYEDELTNVLGFPFPAKVIIGSLLALCLYEGCLTLYLNRHIQKRSPVPNFGHYLSASFEILFVTFILIVLAYEVDPIIAFQSPAVYIYFYFIILSIFRLQFTLGVFTGLLAALGFTFGFLFSMKGVPQTNIEKFLYAVPPAVAKAVFMLISGIMAGFVGNELKKRLFTSLTNITERNRIINMFGQYISPAVAEKLLNQKTEFSPENRYVCVLFLDIRNFTSFSEDKTPEQVISYLNTLFVPLIEIVNKNKGIINKFLGDGFMAVFGAPLSDGQDVRHAVDASFEIIQKVNEMNEAKKIPPTRVGIGLNAGEAMTGNVGSEERKEYTIIGDTANLASRVEGLNKEFQSQLLVTDPVYQVVKEAHPALAEHSTQVKGKKEAVTVYTLI